MEVRVRTVLLMSPDVVYSRQFKKFLEEAEKECGQRFALEHKEEFSLGMERLAKPGIDMVILDLSFPAFFGLEPLSRLYAKVRNIPIIVLLDKDKSSFIEGALYNGAVECLLKNELNFDLVVHSIDFGFRQFQLYTQLIHAKEKIEIKEAQFREVKVKLTMEG